jgi:predicted transcriptional regulator of viral defense system
MRSADVQRDLFHLAEAQGGYFTAKQAASLGYLAPKRNYHVNAGNWVREHRGIYRLALFPEPERPDLIVWWLWSRGRDDSPVGVFSHRTALILHDLTDSNPATIDLTVPPTFRKSSEVPMILHLHFGHVTGAERETISGVPVTNALRTIIDVWHDQVLPKPLLTAALREAIRRGKVTKRQISDAKKSLEMAAVLEAIERGHTSD